MQEEVKLSNTKSKASEQQVGGNHYKDMVMQPGIFCERNNLSLFESCVVKRMCRWRKNTGKGLEDLEKAKHEIELLIELYYME